MVAPGQAFVSSSTAVAAEPKMVARAGLGFEYMLIERMSGEWEELEKVNCDGVL